MCEKVHPIFRKIIAPPCFKKGKYNACPYFQINRERVQGRDHMPPCPLYVYHQTEDSLEAHRESEAETGALSTWQPPADIDGLQRDITSWSSTSPVEYRMLEENIARFERLWKLNVLTGEPLEAAV